MSNFAALNAKMKKLFYLIYLLPALFSAQAPAGYYAGTENLSGYALKTKVQEIISRNYNWHYGDLQNYYKQTDLDVYYDHTPATNPFFNTTTNTTEYIMLDIYSEIPTGPDAYEYHTGHMIGSGSSEGLGYNREHMIPQSTFSTGSISNYPMYSDLFFVIPVDARINQLRSNYPYGIAGTTTYWSFTNTSKIGNSAVPNYAYTGRVYEPIDEFKGDVARALLYFAVRYEGKLSSFNHLLGSGTITPTNDQSPLDGTEERAFDPAYLEMLKQWHILDPVSQREIDRNNAVFSIQKNRNPFVDHPNWVNLIWSETPDGIAPAAPSSLVSTQQNAHFVNLGWTPSADTDILGYRIYMNGASTPIATTKKTNISIDRLSPSSTYTFTIKSFDKGYLESPESNTVTVTTAASDQFAKDLMITKYLEGSGNNKAIEITNNTGHEVNLNNYNLNIQFQNSSTGSYYFSDRFQLEGTVAHGEVFVILNPNSDFTCYTNEQAKFVTASTPLTFTGSQYIELAYQGFETVDAIGTKGSVNSTGNMSLYRLNTINNPTDIFDFAEWQQHPSNYCQNLGSLAISETSGIHSKASSVYPNPVQHFLYLKGNRLHTISEATIIDMNGRVVLHKKQPFQHSNSIDVEHLQPGMYMLKTDKESHKFIKK